MCLCFLFSQGGQVVGLMPVLAACHLLLFQLCALYFDIVCWWRISFSLSCIHIQDGIHQGLSHGVIVSQPEALHFKA